MNSQGDSAPSAAAPQTRFELWQNSEAREQLWELAIENANDPIIITTSELALPGPQIVYVNRAFTHMTGYRADEIVGQTPRILQGPLTDRTEMERMRTELRAGRSFVGETINYTKSGQPYFMEWSVFGLQDDNSALIYYVAVQRDISARKRYESQIEEQAKQLAQANEQLALANARLATLSLTDSLTGIGNHRALHEKLNQELARAARYDTPLALLLLDVDNFKAYNDSFGHPAGDEALQKIAVLLQSHKRQSDVVARHGGEEFAVLLPQTDRVGALSFAEKLRTSVECAAWPLRNVTVSIGIATTGDSGAPTTPVQTARELISRADEALYQSKKRGRNCVS